MIISLDKRKLKVKFYWQIELNGRHRTVKKVCKVPGASGFENKIRETIMEEVRPFVDELYVDNLGSVIAIKKD